MCSSCPYSSIATPNLPKPAKPPEDNVPPSRRHSKEEMALKLRRMMYKKHIARLLCLSRANGGSLEELSRRSSTSSRGSVRITITNIEATDRPPVLDSPVALSTHSGTSMADRELPKIPLADPPLHNNNEEDHQYDILEDNHNLSRSNTIEEQQPHHPTYSHSNSHSSSHSLPNSHHSLSKSHSLATTPPVTCSTFPRLGSPTSPSSPQPVSVDYDTLDNMAVQCSNTGKGDVSDYSSIKHSPPMQSYSPHNSHNGHTVSRQQSLGPRLPSYETLPNVSSPVMTRTAMPRGPSYDTLPELIHSPTRAAASFNLPPAQGAPIKRGYTVSTFRPTSPSCDSPTQRRPSYECLTDLDRSTPISRGDISTPGRNSPRPYSEVYDIPGKPIDKSKRGGSERKPRDDEDTVSVIYASINPELRTKRQDSVRVSTDPDYSTAEDLEPPLPENPYAQLDNLLEDLKIPNPDHTPNNQSDIGTQGYDERIYDDLEGIESDLMNEILTSYPSMRRSNQVIVKSSPFAVSNTASTGNRSPINFDNR